MERPSRNRNLFDDNSDDEDEYHFDAGNVEGMGLLSQTTFGRTSNTKPVINKETPKGGEETK